MVAKLKMRLKQYGILISQCVWVGKDHFMKMDCIEGLCTSQDCHSISWSSKTIISFVNYTIIHIRKFPVLIWLTILWSGVLQPWNVLFHFCQWMNRNDLDVYMSNIVTNVPSEPIFKHSAQPSGVLALISSSFLEYVFSHNIWDHYEVLSYRTYQFIMPLLILRTFRELDY